METKALIALFAWLLVIVAAVAIHYRIIEVKKKKPIYWLHVINRLVIGGVFIAYFTGYPFEPFYDWPWLFGYMFTSWMFFFNYGLNWARRKFAKRDITIYHLGQNSRWDRFSQKVFPQSVVFIFRAFLAVIGLGCYLAYYDRVFLLMFQ